MHERFIRAPAAEWRTGAQGARRNNLKLIQSCREKKVGKNISQEDKILYIYKIKNKIKNPRLNQ